MTSAIWQTVPDMAFIQGTPFDISVAGLIDPAATIVAAYTMSLPSGVTFNSAAKTFHYDGIGATANLDGVVLLANLPDAPNPDIVRLQKDVTTLQNMAATQAKMIADLSAQLLGFRAWVRKGASL